MPDPEGRYRNRRWESRSKGCGTSGRNIKCPFMIMRGEPRNNREGRFGGERGLSCHLPLVRAYMEHTTLAVACLCLCPCLYMANVRRASSALKMESEGTIARSHSFSFKTLEISVIWRAFHCALKKTLPTTEGNSTPQLRRPTCLGRRVSFPPSVPS